MKKTGTVLKMFADKKDNMKIYEVGSIYTSEEERYNELKELGYVDEGTYVYEEDTYE